jgi:hypothetical protein
MYPYFSAGMGIMSNHSLFTFYIPICNPRNFKFLKSESTKTNVIVPIRYSFHFPPMFLMIFFYFGVIVHEVNLLIDSNDINSFLAYSTILSKGWLRFLHDIMHS